MCTYRINIDTTLYTTELGPHIIGLNKCLTAHNTDINIQTLYNSVVHRSVGVRVT